MLASVQVNHRPQLSNTRSPECRYCLVWLLFKFLKLFPLLVSYWLGALVKMTTGETLLDEAITQNRGVILAAPHHGCWELYGLYIAARYPLTSLYRPPRLDYLERVMRAGREHTGARLVRTDTDGIRLVVEALNKGQCIGILPDRCPSRATVFTHLFLHRCLHYDADHPPGRETPSAGDLHLCVAAARWGRLPGSLPPGEHGYLRSRP
jgi:hypothetical protein